MPFRVCFSSEGGSVERNLGLYSILFPDWIDGATNAEWRSRRCPGNPVTSRDAWRLLPCVAAHSRSGQQ